MRPFSSTSKAPLTAREVEKQLLGQEFSRSEKSSPLASVSNELQSSNSPRSQYFRQLADGLASDIIATPYPVKIPPHHLHVYTHKHNTIVTLTRPNGEPMLNMSCGNLGFRKSRRAGYDPAYQLTSHMFAQIQEKGWLMDIAQLEVIFRGFGPGRNAFTKVLLGDEGRNIRTRVCRVADSTRIKFGGTRSRKVRRLG